MYEQRVIWREIIEKRGKDKTFVQNYTDDMNCSRNEILNEIITVEYLDMKL